MMLAVKAHRLPSVCLEFNLQLMSSQKVTSLVNFTLECEDNSRAELRSEIVYNGADTVKSGVLEFSGHSLG